MTPTTEELRRLLAKATPDNDDSCDQCGGYGEYFGHAPDCHNDDCALAGGIDDCNGQREPCQCREAFADAALASFPHLLDQNQALTERCNLAMRTANGFRNDYLDALERATVAEARCVALVEAVELFQRWYAKAAPRTDAADDFLNEGGWDDLDPIAEVLRACTAQQNPHV